MAGQLNLPGLPFPLAPSPAESWRLDEQTGALTVTAAPRTDIFIDPGSPPAPGGESTLNAATLLGLPPAGDFQLSARVTVGFAATFDAGVLLLWRDEQGWGKLCSELSPAGEPTVVSVVCRGVADDANAFTVPGGSVWLRVSRIDQAYAYHASEDGRSWRMVRYFALHAGAVADRVGFSAQSPTGDGCTVTFDEISFVAARVADLRDGS